jgi:hypothetical protein
LALHNQEVRIVDIEAHRLEEVVHFDLFCCPSIDPVCRGTVQRDFPLDCNLVEFLIAKRTLALVGVIERDGDTSSRDTGRSVLVYKILEIIHQR